MPSARLSQGAEAWFVRLRLHRPETHHATEIPGAVHRAASGAREARADHGITGDQIGKAFFAPAFGTGGPFRNDEVAQLGGGIPDPDRLFRRQGDAEIGQHAARVDHGLGAVGADLYQTGGRPSTDQG